MLVKHVTKNIKDVFIGEGWYNWVRINLAQNRILSSSHKINPAFEKTLINNVRTLSK